MTALLGTTIFILGLIIGSFLNVVIIRYNTGRPIFSLSRHHKRSHCMSCNKELSWFHLIPVFSFIFQKGHCSNCKAKISWQYPFVEFVTGILFFLTFLRYSDLAYSDPTAFILLMIFFMTIFSILIIIFVYDLHHKIIPDVFSYSFATLTFIYTLFLILPNFHGGLYQILDLCAGIIFFIPFYLLWKYSKGRWIGLGDGKLAIGIGWMLGFIYGISALIMAFWIGAVVSVVLLFISELKVGRGRITMKTEIPFAPFMIIGALAVFFFNIDLLGISFFM